MAMSETRNAIFSTKISVCSEGKDLQQENFRKLH